MSSFGSIATTKSGFIPFFNSGFSAVATANITMLFLAIFIKLMFLSREGPAETIIEGQSVNLSLSVFIPGLLIMDCPLSNIFL